MSVNYNFKFLNNIFVLKNVKKLGEVFGFLVGYLLFLFLNKIPDECSYFNIVVLTIFIALTGLIIKRLLK